MAADGRGALDEEIFAVFGGSGRANEARWAYEGGAYATQSYYLDEAGPRFGVRRHMIVEAEPDGSDPRH